MINILFICHGNICRSPMAEFVMKYLVDGSAIEGSVFIESKATSTEELGNPPHYGTFKKLNSVGIPLYPHTASQLKKSDYQKFDYIIAMDSYNVRNIMRIIGNDPENKVCKLLDFTDTPGDIADPWYTEDFDTTYNEIRRGCQALLDKLCN